MVRPRRAAAAPGARDAAVPRLRGEMPESFLGIRHGMVLRSFEARAPSGLHSPSVTGSDVLSRDPLTRSQTPPPHLRSAERFDKSRTSLIVGAWRSSDAARRLAHQQSRVFAIFEEKCTMNVIKPFLFALAVFAGGPAALAEQHWV